MTRFLLFLVLFFVVSLHAADGKKAKSKGKQRTIGVLIFPGVEMLDFAGPVEIWGNLRKEARVVTVAKQAGEVRSAQSVRLVADHGFADCPPVDFLLVPGGFGAFEALADPSTLEFVRQRSAQAELTMSVCNGASVLAAAGLLDNRPATTNKAFWSQCIAYGPKVKWVPKARWVDDGNIVTSSGVSAGMDMTLHVVARFYGQPRAERLARDVEYEWHQDAAWDPFAVMLEKGK